MLEAPTWKPLSVKAPAVRAAAVVAPPVNVVCVEVPLPPSADVRALAIEAIETLSFAVPLAPI